MIVVLIAGVTINLGMLRRRQVYFLRRMVGHEAAAISYRTSVILNEFGASEAAREAARTEDELKSEVEDGQKAMDRIAPRSKPATETKESTGDIVRAYRESMAATAERKREAAKALARLAVHAAQLQQKYERAARYPWLPVAPDPPEPPQPSDR
jgi:hypothetical protein